jgi:hypothetical protein
MICSYLSIMVSDEAEQKAETGEPSCPICYEASLDSIAIGGCGHKFCRACLLEFCRQAIQSREIPIACPALGEPHCCENKLEEKQVEALLLRGESQYGSIQISSSPTTTMRTGRQEAADENPDPSQEKDSPQASQTYWERFKRHQSLLQNPTLTECPVCKQLYCMEENKVGDSSTTISQCPSCDSYSCSVHGGAHSGLTCEQYLRTVQAQRDVETELEIRSYTKPCSHCGAAIAKVSGCDHIICPSCHNGTLFCLLQATGVLIE